MTNLKSLDMDYFKKIAERVNREKTENKLEIKVGKPNVPERQTASPVAPITPIATPIKPNPDYWTIPNIHYRDAVGNVDVYKKLLDGGCHNLQGEWASYSEDARKKGDFYTPDLPLFYALANRAFDLKDNSLISPEIEEMRMGIQSLIRSNWPTFLTKIKYTSKREKIELDEVRHNVGLSDEYFHTVKFIGPDGEIPAGSPVSLYYALLRTSEPTTKIKTIFNWVNDTNYVDIFRLGKRSKSGSESIAWLDFTLKKVEINCLRDPDNSRNASLGFRFTKYTQGVTP